MTLNFIITQLTWGTLCYLLYIWIDARQDAEYIKKYGKIYHKWNWMLKACIAIGIGVTYFPNPIHALLYCLVLVPVTWILFDALLNAFLGRNPLTYIGSGHWDEVFKWYFGKKGTDLKRAAYYMWAAKLILLAITLYAYIEFT